MMIQYVKSRRLTPKRIAEGWTRETIHLYDWEKQPLPPGVKLAGQSVSPTGPMAETFIEEVVTEETDDEIRERLAYQFGVTQELLKATVYGDARALVISGAPGVGKSFSVEKILAEADPSGINYSINKGFVRATGLFKLFWQHRMPGQIIVFDDADSVFFDDIALNLLKAVCDTTEKRRVSWLSEAVLIDEESGEKIPRSFEFDGTIIFITNLDFDRLIARSHKLGPHLAALQSRAHYVDLGLKSRRECMIRVKQVADNGLFADCDLSEAAVAEIMEFMTENIDRLREISLRMAIKIGHLRKNNQSSWKGIAAATCLKK